VPATIVLVERRGLTFRDPRSVVIICLAGFLFTYVHVAVAAIPRAALAPQYAARFFLHLELDFAPDYCFFWVVVLWTRMYGHFAEIRQKEVRASQLEASVAQARLRAVEGQLNPHFFFNTLQSISALALSGERESVAQVIGRLSGLLRVTFDRNRPQFTSLARELEFLDAYLGVTATVSGLTAASQKDRSV
jgi:hypothetical protein